MSLTKALISEFRAQEKTSPTVYLLAIEYTYNEIEAEANDASSTSAQPDTWPLNGTKRNANKCDSFF